MSDKNGRRETLNKSRGFSLIEVLISVVILALAAGPLFTLFTSSKKVSYDLRLYTLGLTMAHNVLDEMLAMPPSEITESVYDNYDKKNLGGLLSSFEYPPEYQELVIRAEATPVPNMALAKVVQVRVCWRNGADGRTQDITLEGLCIDRRVRLYR